MEPFHNVFANVPRAPRTPRVDVGPPLPPNQQAEDPEQPNPQAAEDPEVVEQPINPQVAEDPEVVEQPINPHAVEDPEVVEVQNPPPPPVRAGSVPPVRRERSPPLVSNPIAPDDAPKLNALFEAHRGDLRGLPIRWRYLNGGRVRYRSESPVRRPPTPADEPDPAEVVASSDSEPEWVIEPHDEEREDDHVFPHDGSVVREYMGNRTWARV